MPDSIQNAKKTLGLCREVSLYRITLALVHIAKDLLNATIDFVKTERHPLVISKIHDFNSSQCIVVVLLASCASYLFAPQLK